LLKKVIEKCFFCSWFLCFFFISANGVFVQILSLPFRAFCPKSSKQREL